MENYGITFLQKMNIYTLKFIKIILKSILTNWCACDNIQEQQIDTCFGRREENECAMLPDSANGLADAKNTWNIMTQAPILIVVINDNGKNPFDEINADSRFVEICDTLSIGASIENMLLKATELGLGTLWIANTCYAYKELTQYLETSQQLVGAIALGYANEAPMQRPRKKMEEVVEYRF